MKRSTKGAIAAGAAAVLLLGGAGTLAFWTDSATVAGGDLRAGELTLSPVACGDWLEDGVPVEILVPGDTITKDCTGTLTLVGDHIGATVELDDASVAAAEAAFNDAAPNESSEDAVDITAALTTGGGTVTESGPVSVTITVDWPFGDAPDNDAQGVSTDALDSLVINAVQVDPHPQP